MPNVESVIRRFGWDGRGVDISTITKYTGLDFRTADGCLKNLAAEGFIEYPAADQMGGTKIVYLRE